MPSSPLPWRGAPGARPALGVPLPGDGRMPAWRGGRPLKRWRWVGGFGPDVMLCAAEAWIGPLPVRWWAVWDRARGRLAEGMPRRPGAVRVGGDEVAVRDGEARLELRVSNGVVDAVETVSRHGGEHIWTRKRGGVRIQGYAVLGQRRLAVDVQGVADDSAGYHARRTAWRWAAGVGMLATGEPVAWNLVEGLHDAPTASERSVWVTGRAHEVGPVAFAPGLAGVTFAEGGRLAFTAGARRAHRTELGLVASRYEQPFGTFAGELPGAGRLRDGWGVMEDHQARW